MQDKLTSTEVNIPAGSVLFTGNLEIPLEAEGIVVFVHGSDSSRFSPRNKFAADIFNSAGLATLLVDLLTSEEEEVDLQTRQLRFDIDLLAERVINITDWLTEKVKQSF